MRQARWAAVVAVEVAREFESAGSSFGETRGFVNTDLLLVG
jgi:hypothetical protein